MQAGSSSRRVSAVLVPLSQRTAVRAGGSIVSRGARSTASVTSLDLSKTFSTSSSLSASSTSPTSASTSSTSPTSASASASFSSSSTSSASSASASSASASFASLASASSASASPASSSGGASDASSPASGSWKRPLKQGVNPAYDAALAYLSAHQNKALARLAELKAQLANGDTATANTHANASADANADVDTTANAKTAALQAQIDILEVTAYVNDPAVRANFRATGGAGSMQFPVMRALAESDWVRKGGRDVVMGRMYENRVVPDLLEDLPPSLPLTLTLSTDAPAPKPTGTAPSPASPDAQESEPALIPASPEPESHAAHAGPIEPGLVIPSSRFATPPTLTFQPFEHPSRRSASDPNPTAKYTFLVVSPDEPSPDTGSYVDRLHYLKTDIPLSVTTGGVDLFSAPGNEVFSWEPPAPAKGAGRHRYVYMLLRQPPGSPDAAQWKLPDTRDGSTTTVRQFMRTNALSPRTIAAVHLVRSEWTAEDNAYINSVWKTYRGAPGAPVYALMPLKLRMVRPKKLNERLADEARQAAWDAAIERAGGVAAAAGGGLPELERALVDEIESVVDWRTEDGEPEQQEDDEVKVL